MKTIIFIALATISITTTTHAAVAITSQADLDQILESNTFVTLGVFAQNHGLSIFAQKIAEKAEPSVRAILGVPVTFASIDFDIQRSIANRYNVVTAGSFVFFKNSVIVGNAGTVAIASPNNSPKKLLAKMQEAFRITESDKKNTVAETRRQEPAQPSPSPKKIRAVTGQDKRRD